MTGNFVFPRNAFLGFDHIFDALQDIHVHANDGYPPHNVVRDGDQKYVIEMAVAGFNKKDIEIKILDNSLPKLFEKLLKSSISFGIIKTR